MNVELMSGSNLQMNHITTVASVDGTATGTYSYACPQVTPNSAIYFYQFSSPQSSDLSWSTRFTIAATDGSTTPPANANQPSNPTPAIPWGVGQLTNPSLAVAAPTIGGSNSTSATGPGSVVATTSAAGTGGAGTATGLVPVKTTSANSTAPSSTAKSSNSTSAATTLGGSVFGSVVALGAVVALVY
jgi:hypothetical protein